MGAIVLGAVAGVVCLWAVVTLKPMLKYDDALDVFGVHGVGGIVGALGTAIVAAPALGGYALGDPAAYKIGSQFVIQLTGGRSSPIVWSGVVALVAMLIVKAAVRRRPRPRIGRERRPRPQLARRARLQLISDRAGDLPPCRPTVTTGKPASAGPPRRESDPACSPCSSWPATEASHSQTAWAAHPVRSDRHQLRPLPMNWADARWICAALLCTMHRSPPHPLQRPLSSH